VGVTPGSPGSSDETSKEGKPIPDHAAAKFLTVLNIRMIEKTAPTRKAMVRMRMTRLDGLRRLFACGFRLGFILLYPYA
jgi:hypothetical protein